MKNDSILKAAITGVLAFSGLVAAGTALAAKTARNSAPVSQGPGKTTVPPARMPVMGMRRPTRQPKPGSICPRAPAIASPAGVSSTSRIQPPKSNQHRRPRTPMRTHRGTLGPNGATVVNSKPDPRVTFDPDLIPRDAEALGTTWLPSSARRDYPVAHTYWLTRASRGISWHRSGRALVREHFR